MNKNYSLALIVGLLCLIVGILIGKSSNNAGRYFIKQYSDGEMIFDTQTGERYLYDGNKKKYFKENMVDGVAAKEFQLK
ncbi:MAG: hypothetical protein K0M56_00920 [Kaistella sp.]|nr:hypothetical protein [Kaistella sp.]